MQSEEMDNKIREAAEHHHPAYNENAWPEMEKLLDKHLPQKKDDRRKYLLFLLLFLVAGSGVWLMISKPWKKTTVAELSVAEQDNKQSIRPATGTNTTGPGSEQTITGNSTLPVTAAGNTSPAIATDAAAMNNSNQPGSNTNNEIPAANDEKNGQPRTELQANRKDIQDSRIEMQTYGGNKKKKSAATKPATIENPYAAPVVADTRRDNAVNNITPPAANNGKDMQDNITVPGNKNDEHKNEKPVTTIAVAGEKAAVPAAEERKSDPVKENKVAKTKKQPAKKGNSLAISFSAGPDVSMIRFDKTGKVQTILGAGLSYTFNNKITVSTGVYTARKIYTAAPADYKFAYRPPNYNYMTKIDGNCKVLAIPVNVAVNFGKNKKGNWYAGTGLTSLLMKTEKYDYEYKYPSGSSYTYTSNHSNENKHLFSILNISGGYRRNISRSVFVAAEPYLQLPLNSGVGAGKVKMNSAGVLFTIGVKPFSR